MKGIITARDTWRRYPVSLLVDSGCTRSSIDKDFVKSQGLTTKPAPVRRTVRNADYTINGYIDEYVDVYLEFKDGDGNTHEESIELQVVNLGGHDIFLGFDWLETHNPVIDWQDRSITIPKWTNIRRNS